MNYISSFEYAQIPAVSWNADHGTRGAYIEALSCAAKYFDAYTHLFFVIYSLAYVSSARANVLDFTTCLQK